MADEDFCYDELMKGVTENGYQFSKVTTDKPRFDYPVSENDILEKIDGVIPKSTRKSTTWSVNTWEDWCDHRQKPWL